MSEKERPSNFLLVLLDKQNQQDLAIFHDCFLITETIIPLTLVGYEMIIANEAHGAHIQQALVE